jgi:hypothetical protein
MHKHYLKINLTNFWFQVMKIEEEKTVERAKIGFKKSQGLKSTKSDNICHQISHKWST